MNARCAMGTFVALVSLFVAEADESVTTAEIGLGELLILRGGARALSPVERALFERETVGVVAGFELETDDSGGVAFCWRGIGVFQLQANSKVKFERLRKYGVEVLPVLRVNAGALTAGICNDKVRLEIVVDNPPYVISTVPRKPSASVRIESNGTAIVGEGEALVGGPTPQTRRTQHLYAGFQFDGTSGEREAASESELSTLLSEVRQLKELVMRIELGK